ncbi:hypothetical protein E0J21_22295 [Rhizobium laguerreae]|nr:hypothetical protein E0J21_22295 [Rhizobium laguerreae]
MWGDHKWLDLPAHLSFRHPGRSLLGGGQCAQPISPPVGEMPGRAEGVRHGTTKYFGRAHERPKSVSHSTTLSEQTKRPEGVTLPALS